MRMTTPSFRDDADAELHLLRHLRRILLVCYDQDTVSEHTITEEHIADACAHHERFRRSLDLQGINPDTLIACTDEGKTMVRSIINGWVRALRELLAVVETLKKRSVALLSLEETIDTSSAAGELVFHVFGAIAQFERRLIAERTRDGLANARRKGRRLGRPPLDQDKLEAAVLLVKSGMSPTKAARQVGLGRSTLYRELQGSLERAEP